MIKQLKKYIPEKIIIIIKVILNKAEVIPYTRNKRLWCPICKSKVSGFNQVNKNFLKALDNSGFIFNPYQFETLNILEYSCSKCGAVDRERLFGIYLDRFYMVDNFKRLDFLDFAPNEVFSQFVKKNYKNIVYRTADLIRKNVDDNIDITNMNIYKDDQFDFFICSHILEHVREDDKALSELFRILKKGGKGIVMVPIMLTLNEDYENDKIDSEMEKWKHYGQNDHVRMYSKKGFLKKIEDAGFIVNQLDKNYCGGETFKQFGINRKSVLYLLSK
jgi:predicted SAM-dependent methyltransferase